MKSESKAVQFEELLVHASWVRDLARALVRDPNAADDVAQETWLSALQSQPNDRRNLRGWLGKTLTNVVRQRARSDDRRSRREDDHEREPVPTPSELAERLDTQRMLAEEVARLPEPFRATILLCFYEGRTPTEIARDTDTPAGTVRWRLHEGLALLRAKLDTRHGDRKSWMAMLLPLSRPSVVAGGGGAVLGGIAWMSLSTKIAIAATLVLLLAGIATWRASHFDGTRATVTASLAPERSLPSDAPLRRPQQNSLDPDHRVAVHTPSPATMVVGGRVIDLPYPELGLIEKPATGVVVSCVRRVGDGKPYVLHRTTDGDGRFEFEWEPESDREFTPRLEIDADDDYRQTGHFVNEAAPGKPVQDFLLQRAAHGVLEGRVIDETGAPLADVELHFFHKDGESRAVSDANGHFRVDRLHECVRATEAIKSGFREVGVSLLASNPEGGWKRMDVVMGTATGKISLTVIGPSGEPLQGVHAWIEVAMTERDARRGEQGRPMYTTRPKENSPASDAQGRIEFTDVWLNKKLSLSLVDGKRMLQTDRARGEDLIFSTQDGQPIVLSEGAMQLRARLPERMRLSGQVVHPDGSPAAKAHVELQDVDTTNPAMRGTRTILLGDDDGHFLFTFDPSRLPTDVRLVASDGPQTARFGLDQIRSEESVAAPYREATTEVVSLGPDDLAGGKTIRVVIEPTFAIAGRVRDAGGSKAGLRITAVPTGTSDRSGSPISRGCDLANDGEFRIDGLRGGVYDLLIDAERSSELDSVSIPGGDAMFSVGMSPLAPIRVSSIRAGTEDLDLRVALAATAEVTLEARSRNGSADHVRVVFGRSSPCDPQIEQVCDLPSEAIFGEHAGWPSPTAGFGNSWNRSIKGLEQFASVVQPGSSFTLPPLSEGRYWFGLRSRDEATKSWSYTEGTGWVYLRPGKYHFVFDTVPTATVEGRLRMREPDRSMCVALADETGRLLRAKADHWSVDCVFPTGADGSFSIGEAPVGRFTLRVGHEDELRAGRFLTVQQIEVGREDAQQTLIDVP